LPKTPKQDIDPNSVQNSGQKPIKKIKFIRKEWARFQKMLGELPQSWFLYAGYAAILLGFGAAIYQFFWVQMLGG
jgi:hypothetical protein